MATHTNKMVSILCLQVVHVLQRWTSGVRDRRATNRTENRQAL